MFLWIVVQQASLSMDFSRQKYWSGVPFPSPGDSPNPGFEPRSPALQADSLHLSQDHVASELGLSLADSHSVFKLRWMEGHLDSENQ